MKSTGTLGFFIIDPSDFAMHIDCWLACVLDEFYESGPHVRVSGARYRG